MFFDTTGDRFPVVAISTGLIARGHKVTHSRGGFGGYQAILRDHARGVYFGASEARKDGQAAGY